MESTKEYIKDINPDTFLFKLYHNNAKHTHHSISVQAPRQHYPKPSKTIEIPYESIYDIPSVKNDGEEKSKLEETLLNRRTKWDFQRPVEKEEFFKFLQYSFGITGYRVVYDSEIDKSYKLKLRSYPSGGALYPVHIYCYVNNVNDMDKGLYEFIPDDNKLYKIKGQATKNILKSFTSGLKFEIESFDNGGFCIFMVGDFRIQPKKYGLLAYKLTLLEVGHMSQNAILYATSQNINSVPLGGFFEDTVNEFLGIDGDEKTTLYIILFGRGKADHE